LYAPSPIIKAIRRSWADKAIFGVKNTNKHITVTKRESVDFIIYNPVVVQIALIESHDSLPEFSLGFRPIS
jgi:hypothetical protein